MEKMIGVIGGSGVYEIAGLENAAWISVDTPWGAPSEDRKRTRLNSSHRIRNRKPSSA